MENNYLIKNNLILRVYTIGFDPKGESILLTINDGDCILFAGLIDCFITDNNYIINLFDKLNIVHLDYLCITHPDYDHCVGLSSIMDKIDFKTKIAIPNRIFDFMEQYDVNVKESLESLRELLYLRSDSKRKPKFNTVSDNSVIIDNWNFIDNKGEHNKLKILTITPSSNVIERYALRHETGEIIVEHNDFSIINLIQINDIKILLTGDAEDDNIRDAFNNLTEFSSIFFNSKIDFVKIPHHSSRGSKFLLEKIKANGEGIGVSTTTIYRNSSLPDLGIFSGYNACSDLSFCTGTKEIQDSKNGIILYEADITNSKKIIRLIDTAVKFENYSNV